jgi:hypothetical protein
MESMIFLDEQIKFAESINDHNPIKKIIFSINDGGEAPREKIEKKIRSSNISVNYDISYRDNSGYSYANWNETMIKNLDAGFDYHFLMEDDYIPVNADFYQHFVELMDDKIAFVCLKTSENGFMGHQRHPTMSVGMMRNDVAKAVFDSKGTVLYVDSGNSYWDAEQSQIHMMDYVISSGFDFAGISDEISKPFWDNSLGLWQRGGHLQPIIIPIGVEL